MSEEGEVSAIEVVPVVSEEIVDEGEVEGEVKPEIKPEPEPIPKGVQKRIDRAVREKYEAQARTKMLEERLNQLEQRSAQQAPAQQAQGAPKIEQFENFDDYVTAKAEYIADQRINQTLTAHQQRVQAEAEAATQAKTADSWNKKLSLATAELPDFEDVVGSAVDIPMTNTMRATILESDIGPKLAYYLASNPDEAEKIAELSPIGTIRALSKLEDKIKTTVVKVTGAPEPISPTGSKLKSEKSPSHMTDNEFAKWRKSQIAQRGR